MIPFPSNDYECPECGDTVSVPLPYAKYVSCPHCIAKLEIHPDATFEGGMWHDRTELSVVDPGREHIQRMIEHAKRMME